MALALATLAPGVRWSFAQTRPEERPLEGYHDQIVAEVGDEPITFHELELSALLTAEYREIKQNNPGNRSALHATLQKQLDELIDERILLQECVKEKIVLTKEDEKRIDREVDHEAERQGGLEGLKAILQKIGVPFDYFVERKKATLLVGKLIVQNVSRDIYVAPEVIRKFYEEHKREMYKRDACTKFFQLDVYSDLTESGLRTPDAVKQQAKTWGPKAALAFAEDVRKQLLQNPDDWARIVGENTMNADSVDQCGLREITGNQRLTDQLPAPLGKIAEGLKPGDVSPVIERTFGYQVICMKEKTGADVLPFDEVQHEIADRLRNEMWEEKLHGWIKKLRDDAYYKSYLPPE